MTRCLTSRYRPVTLITSSLALWLFLFYYFVQTNIKQSVKDSTSIRMAIRSDNHSQLIVPPPTLLRQTAEVLRTTRARETTGNVSTSLIMQEEAVFAQRRGFVRGHVQQGVPGGAGEVFYYRPAQLAVCHVQKVGCTFWKRVFHFLNGDTEGKNVSSPFEIDRFYVHFGAHKKKTSASYLKKKDLLDSFNKVLFTRDPWARIWSAYIDKFVLPDSWLDHGRSIVSRRKDATRRKACADDIGFAEFLDYALYVNHDAHWKPVHRICNPCVFRPHFVGKMETFSKDSSYILSTVGLASLLQGHDHAHYAEDEVRMLTRYHFRLFETRAPLRKCLTHSGVAERLWKAFVLNGYIDQQQSFPKQEFVRALDSLANTRAAGERAVDLLLNHHGNSTTKTSQQMRDYRRGVMVTHYRQAPRQLLDRLVQRFNGDFDLFGYEARPADIFVTNP